MVGGAAGPKFMASTREICFGDAAFYKYAAPLPLGLAKVRRTAMFIAALPDSFSPSCLRANRLSHRWAVELLEIRQDAAAAIRVKRDQSGLSFSHSAVLACHFAQSFP